MTWFAHDVPGLHQIARLFDLFLASHPLMPLYVAAVAIKASCCRPAKLLCCDVCWPVPAAAATCAPPTQVAGMQPFGRRGGRESPPAAPPPAAAASRSGGQPPETMRAVAALCVQGNRREILECGEDGLAVYGTLRRMRFLQPGQPDADELARQAAALYQAVPPVVLAKRRGIQLRHSAAIDAYLRCGCALALVLPAHRAAEWRRCRQPPCLLPPPSHFCLVTRPGPQRGTLEGAGRAPGRPPPVWPAGRAAAAGPVRPAGASLARRQCQPCFRAPAESAPSYHAGGMLKRCQLTAGSGGISVAGRSRAGAGRCGAGSSDHQVGPCLGCPPAAPLGTCLRGRYPACATAATHNWPGAPLNHACRAVLRFVQRHGLGGLWSHPSGADAGGSVGPVTPAADA